MYNIGSTTSIVPTKDRCHQRNPNVVMEEDCEAENLDQMFEYRSKGVKQCYRT